MKRIVVVLAAGLCACLVQAEPFLIEYSAASGLYPEESGWTRHTHGGGAARSLSDGVLTLDSTASSMICDYYRIDRPITPDPGETFVAEWRVCVAHQSGYWKALAGAVADDGAAVLFDYKEDYVRSFYDGWSVPIAPGVFHTYRLESTSMYDFSLYIDDSYARSGVFDRPGPPVPFAWFGDGSYGGDTLTLTEWDYFRFGVVPEPSGMALVLGVCTYVACRRGREQVLFKGECVC
jgi:hypothetical protein